MYYGITGQGPPVLWLHGLPTSGALWDLMLPAFEEHYTCVVVDLPGFGRSPLMPDDSMNLDDFARELEKLRKDLGFPIWHVVGHDAGSTIAVHYAARYTDHVEKLVLCSPPVFPEHKIPGLIRLIRSPFPGDFLTPVLSFYIWAIGFPAILRKVPHPTKELIADFQRPFHGLVGAKRLQIVCRWGDPVEVFGVTAGLLPQIQAPTLIVHGRKDDVLPVSFALRAADAVPFSEVEILDCGHLLPLLCPEELTEFIHPFLADE